MKAYLMPSFSLSTPLIAFSQCCPQPKHIPLSHVGDPTLPPSTLVYSNAECTMLIPSMILFSYHERYHSLQLLQPTSLSYYTKTPGSHMSATPMAYLWVLFLARMLCNYFLILFVYYFLQYYCDCFWLIIMWFFLTPLLVRIGNYSHYSSYFVNSIKYLYLTGTQVV